MPQNRLIAARKRESGPVAPLGGDVRGAVLRWARPQREGDAKKHIVTGSYLGNEWFLTDCGPKRGLGHVHSSDGF